MIQFGTLFWSINVTSGLFILFIFYYFSNFYFGPIIFMQLKWLSIRYESKNKVLKFHHFWLQARTQIEKSGKKNFFFKLEIWQLRKIPPPQKKKTHIFGLIYFITSFRNYYLSFNKLSIHSCLLLLLLFSSLFFWVIFCVLTFD
jgi:hypothetical protein